MLKKMMQDTLIAGIAISVLSGGFMVMTARAFGVA